MDIWGGVITKFRLNLGVTSMHFWVFFKVKVQNGGILWVGGGGVLSFQIFLGVLGIPVFFFLFFFFWGGGEGVNGRCRARAYV